MEFINAIPALNVLFANNGKWSNLIGQSLAT